MPFTQFIHRFLPAVLLAAVGGFLSGILTPLETASVNDQLAGFPDSHAMAHHLRPGVLTSLCFMPAVAAFYYGLSDALDRYLVRQFLGAFLVCFLTLFSIWFISDLSNHVSNFRESDEALSLAGKYYAAAFPKVFVEFSPFDC